MTNVDNTRIVAGKMTPKEIERSRKRIFGTIKNNQMPQCKLRNNGVHVPLADDELDLSCSSIFDD